MTESNSASKKRVAEVLGLTTRQITNLVEEGMPREVSGNKVIFDLPTAVQWYVRYKEKRSAVGDEEKKNLTTRRLELEVKLAEHELAKAEGSIVTLDYMEQQLSAILQRLRAKVLNLPGKYAPALVGLRTIAESQTRLEAISTEIITALSDTGEDPELDDDADAPDGEGSVAA